MPKNIFLTYMIKSFDFKYQHGTSGNFCVPIVSCMTDEMHDRILLTERCR